MNKTEIIYHLVFVTKYRKKVLTDKVLEAVKKVIYSAGKFHNIGIIEIGSENQDHIHLIIKLRPTQKVSLIVQILKQYTRYYVWQLFAPQLRKVYWYNNYLWSSGYFCSSLGNVSKDVVLQYVENQK